MSLTGVVVLDPSHRQTQSCVAGRTKMTSWMTTCAVFTCVLSDHVVCPDSRPDCLPGHSKVTVPIVLWLHCSPGSRQPAFIKQSGTTKGRGAYVIEFIFSSILSTTRVTLAGAFLRKVENIFWTSAVKTTNDDVTEWLSDWVTESLSHWVGQ